MLPVENVVLPPGIFQLGPPAATGVTSIKASNILLSPPQASHYSGMAKGLGLKKDS
jgi:hypothetical protein